MEQNKLMTVVLSARWIMFLFSAGELLSWSFVFFCSLNHASDSGQITPNTNFMKKKYRLTGFAKLILVLVILVPAALFIAGYVTGEDPISEVREEISKKVSTPMKIRVNSDMDKSSTDLSEEDLKKIVEMQRDEIKDLKKKISDCENSNK